MPRLQKVIGVLALQGCVEPHRPHIEALGARFVEVRFKEQFEEIDALILPGGESTTMLKLLKVYELEEPLRCAIERIPVWGICAGAILLAKEVENPVQSSFSALDISVRRNAYGRQLESFNAEVSGVSVVFIRAPRIFRVGRNVKIEASHNGEPVWVSSGNLMVTTFHPELSKQVPSLMHSKWIASSKTRD